MAHSRAIAPALAPSTDALTADMVGIGMLVGGDGSRDPNIEDTLLFASVDGMERGRPARAGGAGHLVRRPLRARERRSAHPARGAAGVEAGPRLLERAGALASRRPPLRAAGAQLPGTAGRSADDRDRLPGRTARRGPALRRVELRAPANVLRDRPADVLTPAELAKRHSAYRWRLVIGPTYRADMWAALEREPGLSAAALARATYGSFASAWQARRDFAVWRVARGS